ncbi:hypothetical protein ACIQZG_18720 [Lysinibacillus sp. NPDC096418]|uniref:hypothetical protein n=1 Tax=Lysinibacillus sp. NPDC096418 TaxID=3364138 RepID=UPI00382BCD87
MNEWFSGPMILSYLVIWILFIFLQIALEADLKSIIFNPLNLLFIINLITGVTYQIKKMKLSK